MTDFFTKNTTQRGFSYMSFTDRNDVPCSIQKSSLATEDAIWLGADDLGLKRFPGDYTGWHKVDLDTLFPGQTFTGNNRMHLTQAQVRKMLPVLLHFAETGEVAEAGEDGISPMPDPVNRPTMGEMQAMTDPILNDPAAMDAFMDANPLPPETPSERVGKWLSAALDDPAVCDAMKADIRAWFDAGEPPAPIDVEGWAKTLDQMRMDMLLQQIECLFGELKKLANPHRVRITVGSDVVPHNNHDVS